MSMGKDGADRIERRVGEIGLLVLGRLAVGREDFADVRAGTLVLIGNAGPEMWRHFAAGRRDEPDPLNCWIRRRLDAVADDLGTAEAPVRTLYPFDGPPHHPFQRWAVRAGVAFPSPIGLLIHPIYGLWHAYRGAFLMTGYRDPPCPPAAAHPCDRCAAKPCLTACPVAAFGAEGYDVAACVGHISEPHGAACMDRGCEARRACPVGRDFHYHPEQARFHMTAFLAARRSP